MTLAWTVAALQRQQKLPKLQSLLTKRQSERQTPQQMKAVLHQMGEILRFKKRAKGKRV